MLGGSALVKTGTPVRQGGTRRAICGGAAGAAGPMRVFQLGHSLVGRDMPAMLQQLAGPGHLYDSQLGWGATPKAHWGDAPIPGFARRTPIPAIAMRPRRSIAVTLMLSS